MIRFRELARSYRADPRRTLADIQESLARGRERQPGGLRPEDFSIRDLAAALITDKQGEPIGLSALEAFCRGTAILEADGALTPSAFATVTGQVINVAVMEGYQLPEFVLSALVPTITGNAQQARLTGVSLPLKEDKALEIAPGQEFPAVGMDDECVLTPATVKRGAIVRITKEAILEDATGQILDQARRVGELIGLEKEKLLTDYVVGAVAACVTERRVGDSAEAAYNLFYAAPGSRYVNQQVNALGDWTDIDDAEELFLGITVPGTAEAPMLTQRFVLVPPQLRSLMGRILSATETRTGSTDVVVAGNPLASMGLRLVASPLVYTRLVASGAGASDAAGTWFYGDLARAFRYYQNWGLTVEEDRTGAVAFSHDVLAQFKASERGTPVVVEPRVWSKQTPS